MERVIGIGIDIVETKRIETVWRKYGSRFLHRLLSEEELAALISDQPLSATRLAGRWAAKEAVSKALGSGFRGFAMTDIGIYNDLHGMPFARLHGGAADLAVSLGVNKILLSISHEQKYAAAQALVIGVDVKEE